MSDIPKYYHPIFKRPVPTEPNLAPNGSIFVDLRIPDEACLLPDGWNGRYPRTNTRDRITRLSEQQGHRCCYCSKQTWSKHYGEDGRWQDMATVEHIRCKRDGGTFRKSNIVMACSECNNDRAHSNPIMYLYEKLGLVDFELVPIEDENE